MSRNFSRSAPRWATAPFLKRPTGEQEAEQTDAAAQAISTEYDIGPLMNIQAVDERVVWVSWVGRLEAMPSSTQPTSRPWMHCGVRSMVQPTSETCQLPWQGATVLNAQHRDNLPGLPWCRMACLACARGPSLLVTRSLDARWSRVCLTVSACVMCSSETCLDQARVIGLMYRAQRKLFDSCIATTVQQ